MSSVDTMKVYLPYCVKDLDPDTGLRQKRWVVLNRHYVPIGLGHNDNPREEEDYFALLEKFVVKFPGMSERTMKSLAIHEPDSGDCSFYMYDDSTSPWRSGVNLRTFMDRYLKLLSLKTLKEGDFRFDGRRKIGQVLR